MDDIKRLRELAGLKVHDTSDYADPMDEDFLQVDTYDFVPEEMVGDISRETEEDLDDLVMPDDVDIEGFSQEEPDDFEDDNVYGKMHDSLRAQHMEDSLESDHMDDMQFPYFESMETDYDMKNPQRNYKAEITGYDFAQHGEPNDRYVPAKSADNPMATIDDYSTHKTVAEALKKNFAKKLAEANKKEMTLAQLKDEFKKLDIVVTKTDDEYRVNFKGGKEATAYYTDDIKDALDTGKAMAKKAKK